MDFHRPHSRITPPGQTAGGDQPSLSATEARAGLTGPGSPGRLDTALALTVCRDKLSRTGRLELVCFCSSGGQESESRSWQGRSLLRLQGKILSASSSSWRLQKFLGCGHVTPASTSVTTSSLSHKDWSGCRAHLHRDLISRS